MITLIGVAKAWVLSALGVAGVGVALLSVRRLRRQLESLEAQLALSRQREEEARIQTLALQRDLLAAHHAAADAQRNAIVAKAAAQLAEPPTMANADASADRRDRLLARLRSARDGDRKP